MKEQPDTDLLELEVEEDTEKEDFLTFSLEDDEYAVEVCHVTEILGILNITALSGVPEHVKGSINLRGEVIPVIDVRRLCSLEERAYDERTCIVVVNVEGITAGLIVDAVSKVVGIPAESIEPPLEVHQGDGNPYIKGLAKTGENVIFLLDIGSLLGDIDPEWIGKAGEPVS